MTREEKLAAAGEYLLGALEGPALAAFEAAQETDPELAAAVRLLRERLHALDDTVVPEPVPADLWRRIEAGLGSEAVPTTGSVATKRIAPRTRPVPLRWMALAASLVVAAALGYWAATASLAQPEPVMIAVLIEEQTGEPGAIVEAYADDSVVLTSLQAFTVSEGQVLQVWTLPSAETGPVSLGTFTEQQTLRLAGPDLPDPRQGQLYEIALEPAPGSPTGRPTGPVLVKGFAKSPA